MNNELHYNSLLDVSDGTMTRQTTTYYAPSTKGFYNSNIRSIIPDDAVAISESLYQELLTGENEGLAIMPPDDAHDLPYLAEPPAPTAEQQKAIRKQQILARLEEIDAESIRPLRAIASGEGTEEDRGKITELDAEAAALREELANIS